VENEEEEEDSEEVEEDLVTGEDEEDLVTGEDEEDSEEEEEDSGHRKVEDFGAEEVAEAPREGGAAEEALEEGRRFWSNHIDMKECSSAEGGRMPW